MPTDLLRVAIDAGPTENSHNARGIGSVVRSLLDALTPELATAHGVELTYLRRRRLPALSIRWQRRSWAADVSGADPRVPGRLSGLWHPLDYTFALPSDIRAAGAQIYIATDPWIIARSHAFATVAILYDVIPLVFPEIYLTRRWGGLPAAFYERRLRRMRAANWSIAISEATKQDAVRVGGFDDSRMSVAPLGVDPRRFPVVDPAVARAVVAERFRVTRPYFFFIGARDPRKNLETLLAAHAAWPRAPIDLVIAGQPAPEERTAGVHWLGHVDSDALPFLYAGAVAFVFPSLYEGFGLPVLEAMACGAAVLASRLSSIPEVGGDAVMYCDPRERDSLLAAMQRLAGDAELQATLRAGGPGRAAQFTWSRTAGAILDACRAAA